EQFVDPQIFRPHVIERRNFSFKRMVPTAKRAGFLKWKNVSRLFNNAKQLTWARGIRANLTNLFGSKKSAERARMNSLPRFSDGARDLTRLIVSHAHDPERNPLRRARSDSRHVSQLRNQIPDCHRIFRLFQNTRRSILGAFPLIAEQAAPAGANRIAAEDRLLPPSPAPSETRYTLLPNVS